MKSDALESLGRGGGLLMVYGVIAVVFGVFALFRPTTATVALAWLFGVMALVEGAISAIALVRSGSTGGSTVPRGWLALYALASITFGVLAIINPVLTASVLLLFLAAWLVVGGIYRLVLAIRIRKQIRGEWLIALSGVLAIVLGLLFAGNPMVGLAVTGLWIGIGALLYGAAQIFAGIKLRSLLGPR